MASLAVIAGLVTSGAVLSLAAPAAASTIAAVTDTAAMTVWPKAATNDFAFDSFHAEYRLSSDANKNARLSVVETLVARFPDFDQNRGIERAIPATFGKAKLDIRVSSVTDAAGTSIPFTERENRIFTTLRIGDADRYVHGEQTYVITYTARNVIRDYADTKAQEFYWDINGTGWAQPFGTVTTKLTLDKRSASQLTGEMACYEGIQGGIGQCTIARDGQVITAASTRLLNPRETVTIAVGFKPGTFAKQFVLSEQWYMIALRGWVPWLVALAAFALLLFTIISRIVTVRDAPGRPWIIPEYTPPADIDPMLAAHLLKKPERALPAQLVAFAVSHHVRLIVNEKARRNDRYRVALTVNPTTSLSENEKSTYARLFGGKPREQEILLDPRDHKLGERVARAMQQQQPELKRLGLTTMLKPWGSRVGGVITTLLLLALAGIIVFLSLNDLIAPAPILATVVTVPLLIVRSMFAGSSRRLTAKGAEVRDHLLGLREYIRLAEADRLRVLQGPQTAERIRVEGIDINDHEAIVKLHERLLPYAMIFGLEKEWVTELARDYATESPSWLDGGDIAVAAALSTTLPSTLFAPSPSSSSSGFSSGSSSWSSSGSSSSSGGSSGGGFSGGGGGGGGGGGW